MHAILGAEVAQDITGAEDVSPAIRHHHEAHDGSGYPDGLSGEAIPLAARVVAAADLLDHLVVSSDPEGGRDPMEVAVEMLNERAGRELDPEIVRACAGAYGAGLLTKP